MRLFFFNFEKNKMILNDTEDFDVCDGCLGYRFVFVESEIYL